ncbi:aminotransferase class III-fold pyridoxal phosphate-dependent enzyme [Candidatus Dojkabacteria bacterium]|nr:aminotransferase class III-fold pyridoxal phosphate-dependent enzyme [Candidatus Dojkabacteria bacterium]
MSKINGIIQQKKMASTYPNRGITFVRGEGVYLYDYEDREYLDMMSNFGVNIFGHSHPGITRQLKEQLDKLTNLHSSFSNDVRSGALKNLSSMLSNSGFSKLKRIYWGNSGTEAVEAALKFAIQSSEKTRFMAAHNSYHGKTIGALSMTTSGNRKYQKPFSSVLLSVDFVEYGDIEQIKEILTSEHAALILEPIQGEGGFIIPPPDYLVEVSQICKERGVILIIDEIQTGMGRTGYFLNTEQYTDDGFEPDILCMAKGLGGGIPVGATIITEEINSKLSKGIQTSTFGGNPLSMAGVLAALDFLKSSSIIENARDVGEYFMDQLKASEIGKEIRGKGLMIGVEMEHDPIQIIKSMQQEGILVAPSSDNTIRFLPPLTIEKNHVDLTIEQLQKCVEYSQ